MKSSNQLTKEIKAYAENQEIDIFGIADVKMINEHARKGRRPQDFYPSAKAVLIFGCGMADPFSRGWVYNGTGGAYFSLTSSELENRKWKLMAFLRNAGYQSFGGEMHGGGMLESGLRMANIAERIGIGYIGKSNLLITEKYGPRQNLHFLATDAPLLPDSGQVENQCGSCRVCQEFCTSGAIMGDGYFHARQCEAVINCGPNKIHYTRYVNTDCDMCLRMCPQGKHHWEQEERQGTWVEKLEKVKQRESK